MPFFPKLLLTSVAILIAGYFLPGIHVSSFWTALLVALVLSFLNVFLKPLMVILTIPFTVITFGLFLLVINAFIIMIAGAWVNGFKVDGFWWAMLFSIILSVISSLLERLVKHDESARNF
ncbi:MAG: phage holin family protein [Bacteroidetes bacterium]|nr:phage holin family protein [Bacteroidota bacterium]